MDSLLNLYFKKIVTIATIVFLYNLSLLLGNIYLFLVPAALLIFINVIVPSQAINLDLRLLKSLPIDKNYISVKTIKLFLLSILGVKVITLIFAVFLSNYGTNNLDLTMALITFLMALPIVILTFSLFLPNIVVPRNTEHVLINFGLPIIILLITSFLLFQIINLEVTPIQIFFLGVLALPLYILSVWSSRSAYKEIITHFEDPIDLYE